MKSWRFFHLILSDHTCCWNEDFQRDCFLFVSIYRITIFSNIWKCICELSIKHWSDVIIWLIDLTIIQLRWVSFDKLWKKRTTTTTICWSDKGKRKMCLSTVNFRFSFRHRIIRVFLSSNGQKKNVLNCLVLFRTLSTAISVNNIIISMWTNRKRLLKVWIERRVKLRRN